MTIALKNKTKLKLKILKLRLKKMEKTENILLLPKIFLRGRNIRENFK
jgi:hypothetical protein